MEDSEGNVGYMTWDEWARFQRAGDDLMKHRTWWRVCGNIRGGDADELKTRGGGPGIPLSAAWLAVDELESLLSELRLWSSDEEAVSTVEGHEIATVFRIRVESAVRKWPLEEKPHRVKHFRCQSCGLPSLRYLPPMRRGDAVLPMVVKCTNRSCGVVLDEVMFAHVAAVIAAEWELKSAKRLGDGGGGDGAGGEVAGDDLPVGVGSVIAGANDATVGVAVGESV